VGGDNIDRNVDGEKKMEGNKRETTEGVCVRNTVGAIQESKKGKAKGGLTMGRRKEGIEKGKGIEVEKERIMVGRVKMEKQRWRIVGKKCERKYGRVC